jgi:hypothetical protein
MLGSQVALRPDEVGRKIVVTGGTWRGFWTAPRLTPVTCRGLWREEEALVSWVFVGE